MSKGYQNNKHALCTEIPTTSRGKFIYLHTHDSALIITLPAAWLSLMDRHFEGEHLAASVQ